MKPMKNLMITFFVVAMSVFLCGCPGASYVDNEPNMPCGYIVKMDYDYSENVMAYMNATQNDTIYSINDYISKMKHTKKIINDFYQLTGVAYNQIAYTSILFSEWNDSTIYSHYNPIEDYIVDSNPFNEIYAYYKNYTISELIELIKKGDFLKLEKLR